MDNDNGLLSQEEVDALFKQATGKSVERQMPPAFEKPAAASVPAQASEPLPSKIILRQVPATPVMAPAASPAISPPVTQPALKSEAPGYAEKTQRITPTTPPHPKLAGVDLMNITASLDNISQRLHSLENRIRRLEQEGLELAGDTDDTQQSRTSLAIQQIKSLAAQMENIQAGLKNTPDYNLRADFICEGCGARGTVGTRHRCNKCGREGWWGWWPKQNHKK
jgi:hypothetical protein